MSKKQENNRKVSQKTVVPRRLASKAVVSCAAAVAAVMLCTMVQADTPDDFLVSTYFKYYNEWSGDKLIIGTHYDEMSVEEDGYPAVETIVEEANARYAQSCEEFVETNREKAQEAAESSDDTEEYSLYIFPSVTRADSEIFSFTESTNIYMGSEQGSYYETGYTYDTQSGEQLTLRDVEADYDALYQSVVARLDLEEDEEFLETYPEAAPQNFYEKDGPVWYVTTNELVLEFFPNDSSYDDGMFFLSYEFENYPELFNERIVYDGDSKIFELATADEITGDFNHDDEMEWIYTLYSENEDGYTSDLQISWNGVEMENPFNFSGYLNNLDLVETADQKVYLYAFVSDDDGWRSLYIFAFDGDRAELIDSVDNLGVHGDLLGNPEKMWLCSKVNILGSYDGVCTYQVGENGVPESLTSEYQIVQPDWASYEMEENGVSDSQSDWNTLTSALDLQVWVQNGDSEEAAYYPAGTTFTLRATDGETYVKAELEDGTLCKIYLEEDDGEYTISGVSEYDCFEELPYAG